MTRFKNTNSSNIEIRRNVSTGTHSEHDPFTEPYAGSRKTNMRFWSEHVIAILSLNSSYQVFEKETRETGWHGLSGHRNTGTEDILKLQTDIFFLLAPVLCQDIAYIIHEKGISG